MLSAVYYRDLRMRIAIEGSEMKLVDFDEVLDVFRENNRHISL